MFDSVEDEVAGDVLDTRVFLLGGVFVTSTCAGVVVGITDRNVETRDVGARVGVRATLVLNRGRTGAALVTGASVLDFSTSGLAVGLRIPPGRRIFFGVSVVASSVGDEVVCISRL